MDGDLTDTDSQLAATPSARKRGAWRWWLLGLVCAAGLGIFMWAVGGCWNVKAPVPSGPAVTPQEAVQKFMAATDRHEKGLAGSYCTPDFVEHDGVDGWVEHAGYLRFVDAVVVSDKSAETVVRVRYKLVTRFLDDEDPQGLNLAFVVFPQNLTTEFSAVEASDGTGWLIDDSGPEL